MALCTLETIQLSEFLVQKSLVKFCSQFSIIRHKVYLNMIYYRFHSAFQSEMWRNTKVDVFSIIIKIKLFSHITCYSKSPFNVSIRLYKRIKIWCILTSVLPVHMVFPVGLQVPTLHSVAEVELQLYPDAHISHWELLSTFAYVPTSHALQDVSPKSKVVFQLKN